jgi:Domain of unknown function (DUF4831)
MSAQLWAAAIAAATFLMTGCVSKIVTHRVTSPPGSPPIAVGRTEGMYYSLPDTVLQVEVPVVKTVVRSGEFADLVPHFFSGKTADPASTTYTLGEARFTSRGVPNPNNVFLVDVKGGRFEDKQFGMKFSADFVVNEIQAESVHRGGELLGQALKTAAAIASSSFNLAGTAGLMAHSVNEPPSKSSLKTVPCAETEIEAKALAHLTKTEADAYCSMSIANRERFVVLTTYFQAEFFKYAGTAPVDLTKVDKFFRGAAAYERIRNLQAQRENLLASAPSADSRPEYMKLLLDETTAAIKGYTAQFLGTEREEEIWVASYEIQPPPPVPPAPPASAMVFLFGLSPTKGICSGASGLSAEQTARPILVRENTPPSARHVKICESADTAQPVNLSLVPQTTYAATIASSRSSSGIYYRVPGKASLTLRLGEGEIAKAMPAVAQYGPIVSLPDTTGGRKTQYMVELHPATGAIKSFTMAGDAALEKANIADVETAATGLIDAAMKKRAADEAETRVANDELAALERRRKVLEEKVKIQAARETLREKEQQ